MKKLIAIVLVVAVLAVSGGVALAGNNNNGNGAPSGPHYNLNLIGVKDDHPKNDIGCGNGHRIFVKLGTPKNNNNDNGASRTDIYLKEGDDFAVLDCDGTDGKARFQLPNPDPGNESPCTAYSVYIRVLGKPNGSFKMATCGEICTEWDGDVCIGEWERTCSTEYVEMKRTTGKQKFENVSKELLTLCVWVEDDEEWQRIYLFDPMFEEYLWQYDNNGAKLVQMRFYYEETCYGVNGSGKGKWGCPDLPPPE